MSQMQDLIPVFRYMRLFNYPWHHSSCCFFDRCDPGFDPYASFIFEDNLFKVE
ncbi:MAG: hypothetical protein WDZ28_00885 [Simkaniaceae bacterium]